MEVLDHRRHDSHHQLHWAHWKLSQHHHSSGQVCYNTNVKESLKLQKPTGPACNHDKVVNKGALISIRPFDPIRDSFNEKMNANNGFLLNMVV